MPGRPYARSISFDVALKMKAMYDELTPAGGRVWSMEQIAEKWSVSASSVRRAILGIGGYRHVPDPVPMLGHDELMEQAARMEKLAREVEAARAADPDARLGQMDAKPLRPADAILEGMAAQPIDRDALKRGLEEIEARRKAAEGGQGGPDAGYADDR